MKFQVIIPSHDPHLQCFAEMATSISWALNQLGHEVSREAAEDARPIYLGLPLGAIPANAILFNGEQVSPHSLWQHRRLFDVYKRHTVWDYSRANAELYKNYALPKPPAVRPGYCPALLNQLPARSDSPGSSWQSTPKTHDVVFFGSSNPRREGLLQALQDEGVSVLRVPFGVYGDERNAILDRGRLALNIHFYNSAIFEAVRCSLLVHLGIATLTESSVDSEEHCWGILSEKYDQLLEATLLLMNSKLLENRAVLQLEALKRVSLVDDVGEALEQLDREPVVYSVSGGEPAGIVSTSVFNEPMTLTMIVKNERDVIERCLESVKPHLSRWSIVDTGSTDGTQDIIRACMAGIPGTLHELPWREYDKSRTEALDLARAECKEEGWIFTIDADEIFMPKGPIELGAEFDCYTAWITRCVEGCQMWGRFAFMRANKPWHYQLPRHEALFCRVTAPSRDYPIDNALILSTREGARGKVGEYEKYMDDARVLEKWIIANPGSDLLPRAQYYLAQSYRDASTGKVPLDRAASQKSIINYLKRAEMDGFDQETLASYLWAADGMAKCGYPWEQVQQTLLKAFNFRSIRAEPVFQIGEYYRKQGQYHIAEIFLRKAASLKKPLDSFPDLDESIYRWKAKEELAVALTYLGGYEEAKRLNREVLAGSLPDGERIRIEVNLKECLKWAPD